MLKKKMRNMTMKMKYEYQGTKSCNEGSQLFRVANFVLIVLRNVRLLSCLVIISQWLVWAVHRDLAMRAF